MIAAGPPFPSTAAEDLADALDRLRSPDVLLGCRTIAEDDAEWLFPEERAPLAGSVDKVRRQSGAARRVVRGLLSALGHPHASLPPRGRTPLIWPQGIVGSLAHDGVVAVAAVARTAQIAALGIDVEPAEPLPAEIVRMVATPRERARLPASVLESRVLFCAKEAVYKACNPLDGRFLEFHDVEIDLETSQALVRGGRRVGLRIIDRPRVVALALIPRAAPDPLTRS